MPDWLALVRKNLQLSGFRPGREAEIVEEIARQLEDVYGEAVKGGASEEQACETAEQHISDWGSLQHEIAKSQREKASAMAMWQEKNEERDIHKRGKHSLLTDLRQDLLYGLRLLAKNPGFTTVALLTLALGIGANAAIFGVVNAVLLQPLPYAAANRLVAISQTDRNTGASGVPVSFTKFSAILEQSKSLESAGAFYAYTPSLISDREPELLNAVRVSEAFFRTLRVTPALGRSFLSEDEAPGGADVAVISNAFWHERFAADPQILGKALLLDGKSVTVVGILPASFRFPLQYPEPALWLPRVFEPTFLRPEQVHSGAGYLGVIARVGVGESLPREQAELDTIDARYREQFGSYVDATRYALTATPLSESLVGSLRTPLLVLLAVVGFVLLIACTNVANLLLARATSRDREIGIRKALGATRARLVRQLLSESLLLAVGGGILGVGLAALLLPALRTMSPGTVPRIAEVRIDMGVLLFSLALCGLTGVLFGLMPSLQSAGQELQDTLKEGGRGSSAGGRGRGFRSMLVVGEIGMALVLITCAGLLIESFVQLMRVNPGLTSKDLMTFPLSLPPARYAKPPQQEAFYRQLLERVRTIPEIQAAGLTSYLPLSAGGSFGFFCPEGTVCRGLGKDPVTALRQVSPGYFEALQIPLLRGRLFTDKDIAGGQLVVIVNQTMAKRYWPGQNPIGKHLANSRDMIQREIVGIVGDVRFSSLNAANSEEIYLPMAQIPSLAMTLVVRSTASRQPLVAAVRARIAEGDRDLPVTGILSMDDVISTSVAQPRILMQFVGVFATFALLLAAVGIYGVMAYSVTARKQEMGIRVALGARPADILKLVVGQGMRMAGVGVTIGIAASLAATRVLSGLLFGVRTRDPFVFAGAALVLASTAFWACYLPARRATRVDPNVALRYE